MNDAWAEMYQNVGEDPESGTRYTTIEGADEEEVCRDMPTNDPLPDQISIDEVINKIDNYVNGESCQGIDTLIPPRGCV